MNLSTRPLDGRIALITGASRGIGRAIAQRLAAAGATVVVTARSLDTSVALPGTLMETVGLIEAAGGKALPLAADLDNPVERDTLVARTVEAAGGLDILVNNAGFARYAPVKTMNDEFLEQTFNHYQRVPIKLAQAAIPEMRHRGAGWIVNVGSVTAQLPADRYDEFARHGGATVYAAAKAFLNRFTVGLAAELLDDNIAVNLVAPSTAISTPGADVYIPEEYPTEPVEYLAETALALCHLPARERSGLITHSLHFPDAMGFAVYSLDGREKLPPPTIPDCANPAIIPRGE
ncbi:SDR family NAD(P)-dependent oxidoreductase [Parahaliea maris]|uniref:SDR family NAD(P)-dependent oxidoreductase n=1 Tax=Parahaliea maris TaxID=2716870 RepID=A0A5C9A9D3_9GAMM|nr:SDR family NAD(P)-dependent oxidoreductase [Parahaliea maris]TXS95861.1 SDR family NAD(P)-dependent oxidoreductase [Parahaliea maris]